MRTPSLGQNAVVKGLFFAGLIFGWTMSLPAHNTQEPIEAAVRATMDDAAIMKALRPIVEGNDGGPPDQKRLEEGVLNRACLDSIERMEGVLQVSLTLPDDAATTRLGEDELERLNEALWNAVVPDSAWLGVRILARVGAAGDYRMIETFLPQFASPITERNVDTSCDMVPGWALKGGAAQPASPRGGGVPNPGRQPGGALSGVLVFCNAGHGWTAGNSNWALQRPLLLDMVEDYGNLEELNTFAEYAYNAGATIVPYRPIGYQSAELVIDNDDPEATYMGAWFDGGVETGYYETGRTVGASYRFAAATGNETATARFTPSISQAGIYPVYAWALDGDNRALQTYRVRHSGGVNEVGVDHRMVGQGWVWLGNYHFDAGQLGFVEISNQTSLGTLVIADAIRFGNGIGDVVGAGPNRVSGYPREEEGSRYWAESETRYHSTGMPSSIYDCCAIDLDDNVGTAARWAREMNRATVIGDRWRRVFIEFHSNAFNGTARGTTALVHADLPTSNQQQYATILGNEVRSVMQSLNAQWEYPWGNYSNPYTGVFGAIGTHNNGNEFDATILEVAFHDNQQDAALLLSPKVRIALARASVQGIIRFLNGLPGSGVPLAFPPSPPRQLSAVHTGAGGIRLSWQAGSDGIGEAPTGHRVFRSENGKAFDGGVDVGNVLTTTLTDVPELRPVYFRIAAYNAGGQSAMSEAVGVRRAAVGGSRALIVQGFDRLDRRQCPTQALPAGNMLRPIARRMNTFDYVVQHGASLASSGVTFDSCSNEAVIGGDVSLRNYAAVFWILGEESSTDRTFDANEQALVQTYLGGGGNLFVSGTELAWELDSLGRGSAFYRDWLGAAYQNDNAGTTAVGVVAGGIFEGLPAMSFSEGSGAPYNADSPDQIGPSRAGAMAALNYLGGAGGGAAVQYEAGAYRTVVLGFPFECISDARTRDLLMERVAVFFDLLASTPNDDCSAATVIDSLPFSAVEDTTAARRSAGDPAVCVPEIDASVWYRYTSQATEYIDIQTCGSDYDTVLSVYTGACGVLIPLLGACNNDTCGQQSKLAALQATAGTTYFIMAADAGEHSTGGGSLAMIVKRSPDTDGDSIPDVLDNCPDRINPGQDDTDGDGLGDPCDRCPTRREGDVNGDGVMDGLDVAPFAAVLIGRLNDPSAVCAADMTGDAAIGVDDVEAFVYCLTAYCP